MVALVRKKGSLPAIVYILSVASLYSLASIFCPPPVSAEPAASYYATNVLTAQSGRATEDAPLYALMQAQTAYQNNKLPQAAGHMETALQQDPTNLLFLNRHAQFCEALASEETLENSAQQFWRAKAMRSYERLYYLLSGENTGTLAIRLAMLSSKQGDLEGANRWYQKALRAFPDNALLHFNQANLYEDLGYLDKAETHYRKAITLNPKLLYAYNNLALLLEHKKDLSGAETLYKAAIKLDATYMLAKLNLASLYLDQGRWQDANSQYEAVLQQAPDTSLALLGSSKALMMMNQPAAAIKHLDHLSRLQPKDSGIYYLLAVAHLQNNNMQKALGACQQYLSMEPKGPFNEEIRALLRTAQGLTP